MNYLLDDIEELLRIGAGYAPRLKKIKKNIQAKKPLWQADVLYIKQLSNFYLPNKEISNTPSESEQNSLKPESKTYEDESKEKEIPFSKKSEDKEPNTPKNEKIIPIVTIFALGLFFVFIIFPLPENTSAPNESIPFDSESLGFSSNTAIESSSSTIISNLENP